MSDELSFGKNHDLSTYKYEIDLDVAGLYASEKCKRCYGKGYLVFESGPGKGTLRRGVPILQRYEFCSCVRKNQKKHG